MNLSIIAEAITNQGAISADWVLITVVGLCGSLIIILGRILLGSINSIKKDVNEIKNELHEFMTMQSGFNHKIEERTKDL